MTDAATHARHVAVGAITTEILRNGFNAIAEEMNATLIRAAYTPIIYEFKDCAVALLDESHQTLGQSSGLPIFLGALEYCTRYTEEHLGRKIWREDEVWLLNDAYIGGTHLNDMTVYGPLFFDGELVGFAASRAHWLDVGGKDPGGPADSTDIYQEGLRLGPTRVVAEGAIDPLILDLLTRNGRYPESAAGDLRAQIATVRVGQRRLAHLMERYGADTVRAARDRIFAQSERLSREAVGRVPDGRYAARGSIDNDGVTGDPRTVVVEIVVSGTDVHIDLSGSDDQAVGPVNCGAAQAVSACRLAFKLLIDPDRPVTGGTFAPLSVHTRPGSMLAAEAPAPCQWYFSQLGLLIDLVITALSGVLPDRAAAAAYGDSMNYILHGVDDRTGREFLDIEATVGGSGAWANGDGVDAIIDIVEGGLKDGPIEIVETRYPYRVERYEIRRDSGGRGRWRGGNGVVRQLRILTDTARLSLWFERSQTPAWGLHGGESATGPRVTINPGALDERRLLKVNGLELRRGDVIRMETGGGGGWGLPASRPRDAIASDLDDGLVSLERATSWLASTPTGPATGSPSVGPLDSGALPNGQG